MGRICQDSGQFGSVLLLTVFRGGVTVCAMQDPSRERYLIGHWQALVTPERCFDTTTYDRFQARVAEGSLTRDENPDERFCVYFLPYNANTKEAFIIHHRKSGLWLAPGGHLDRGESPEEALNREIEEELGVAAFFPKPPAPFFFSIVDIDPLERRCAAHFDLWYLMETDGSDFKIDPREFHASKWVSIEEARTLVTDPSNLRALDRVELMGDSSAG